MSSASLFEQLTSNVSLSLLAIVSVAILALLLLYTIVGRVFFSSPKSKTSTTNQQSNKEKKLKESNSTKKQQVDATATNQKKNNKVKKNAVPAVVTPASSSSTAQSDESDNEKVALVTPAKKPTPPAKASTGKKVAAVEEVKTTTTKQQQVPTREQNTEGQNSTGKNKQTKNTAPPVTPVNPTNGSNKQKPPGKRDGTAKVNNAVPKKNDIGNINAEPKRTLTIDAETGQDQEDEGQWLTQGSKQVNQRNRNKGKTEPSNSNNQTAPIPNVVIEQRPTSNVSTSPPVNNTEINAVETPSPSIQNQGPIEIYQLLPRNNDIYTSSDNWWKNALNKQPTFSIDDIGEWPEYEPDEQYIVQVKQIIPI